MNSLMAEVMEGHIRAHALGQTTQVVERVVAADELVDVVRAHLK